MVRINDALFDLPFPLTILIILFISYAWNPKFTCHLGYELYTNYVDHFFDFLTPLPPSWTVLLHRLYHQPLLYPWLSTWFVYDPLYVVYMFVGSKEE